jgi:hypothetical protein
MIFSEKTEVTYRGMFGIIDFICEKYIVLQIPAASANTNPARLIVFREYYKEIEILKASEK